MHSLQIIPFVKQLTGIKRKSKPAYISCALALGAPKLGEEVPYPLGWHGGNYCTQPTRKAAWAFSISLAWGEVTTVGPVPCTPTQPVAAILVCSGSHFCAQPTVKSSPESKAKQNKPITVSDTENREKCVPLLHDTNKRQRNKHVHDIVIPTSTFIIIILTVSYCAKKTGNKWTATLVIPTNPWTV